MADNATLFCSDEDLAIYAGADFVDLVPTDQALAAGNDGAFAAGSRWTLTSASVADFAAQGVAAGQVAVLMLPRQGMGGTDPQLLVVDSVSTGSLTLRRKGQASGVGQPPGTIGGEAAVQFTVATLAAEIDAATTEIKHHFGIDETIAGRRTSDLYDVRELRRPCVLAVLWRRYFAIAQRGSPESREAPSDSPAARAASYWAKSNQLKQEFLDTLDRTVIHWRTSLGSPSFTPGGIPATTRFSTRISR